MAVSSIHPLAPAPIEGVNRAPLRRPRFTNAEALILNMIINANGEPVTARKLAMAVNVMRQSVHSYIGTLRAKLGEPRYTPVMIVTDWPCEENDYQTGWKWIEPS